jgi:hypothetical protein
MTHDLVGSTWYTPEDLRDYKRILCFGVNLAYLILILLFEYHFFSLVLNTPLFVIGKSLHFIKLSVGTLDVKVLNKDTLQTLHRYQISFQPPMEKDEKSDVTKKFRPLTTFSEGKLLYVFGIILSSSVVNRTDRSTGLSIPISENRDDNRIEISKTLLYAFRITQTNAELISVVGISLSQIYSIFVEWFGLAAGISNSTQQVFSSHREQLLFSFLRLGAWYTNGFYAVFLSPPIDSDPDKIETNRIKKVSSFVVQLRTGKIVEKKVLFFFVLLLRIIMKHIVSNFYFNNSILFVPIYFFEISCFFFVNS